MFKVEKAESEELRAKSEEEKVSGSCPAEAERRRDRGSCPGLPVALYAASRYVSRCRLSRPIA
jgi:hypothetical protein